MNKWVLAVLVFGVSIVGLSMGATLPVVALRLFEGGASTLQIGVVSALPAAGMMLSAFIVDFLCRHLTRRGIYLLCLGLCALSIGAIELTAGHPWLLALARLGMGLGMGVVIILGESWVNEMCEEAVRGRVVALYATSFTAFQLLGPAMVGLFGPKGPQVIELVLAGYVLALALVAWAMPRDKATPEHSGEKPFGVLGFIKVAPALCMGILFFSFFDSVVLSMFPVYATSHGHPVPVAALMATLILLGDAACQLPLGWLSDRCERSGLYLTCGVVALAIGAGLPWLIEGTAALWPALLVLGAVAGGIYTLAIVLIGQRFSGQALITANACAGFLWGVGSLCGPLVSGALMGVGEQGVPLALSVTAALFVCFALGLYRQRERAEALLSRG